MEDLRFTDVFEAYRGSIRDMDAGFTISHGRLKELKAQALAFYRAHGVCAQQRVALVMRSAAAFIVNFFALMEAGAIPVLLSKNSRAYEIKELDANYGLHWVVSDCLGEEDWFRVEPLDFPVSFENEYYRWSLKKVNEAAPVYLHLKGTILQPTSGSTGKSRLCVRDERGCMAEPLNHIATAGDTAAGAVLCPVPLNHAYGFGTAFLFSFITSSDMMLLDEFNPRKIIHILEECKVSVFTGVPSIMDLLTKIKISGSIVMPEMILSAGAILEKETAVNFYNRFKTYIHPSYGSTETGEICLERENLIPEAGNVGKPLKETRVRLCGNEDGFTQIVVSNPSMMLGYLKEDGEVDTTVFNEKIWFPVGDMGFMDDTGRLVLNGRLKNMINVFGVKVNPLDVERVIKEIGGIVDVHVYAGRHRSGSDLVFAMVQCSREIEEHTIIEICKERLAPQKVPSRVFIADRLPRNQSGKIIPAQLPRE